MHCSINKLQCHQQLVAFINRRRGEEKYEYAPANQKAIQSEFSVAAPPLKLDFDGRGYTLDELPRELHNGALSATTVYHKVVLRA